MLSKQGRLQCCILLSPDHRQSLQPKNFFLSKLFDTPRGAPWQQCLYIDTTIKAAQGVTSCYPANIMCIAKPGRHDG